MLRRGLTLMELIVVLVILVALAGIIIPVLPNMLGRAHTSVGAANTTEAVRLVQTYEQLYTSYPDRLDNLAGTASAPIDYIPGGLAGGLATQLEVRALTASEATALKNAGIAQLADLFDTKSNLAGKSPTFDAAKGTFQPVAAGTVVSFLKEAAAEGPNGVVRDDPAAIGDVYVIVGFGKLTTAIGKVISDAPVHFSDNADQTPSNVYGRIGLVFRVTRGGTTPTPLDRAAFVGAVSFHPDSIITGDGHLAEYYNITK